MELLQTNLRLHYFNWVGENFLTWIQKDSPTGAEFDLLCLISDGQFKENAVEDEVLACFSGGQFGCA